ncbi:MAG: hypothetical protein NZL87_07125 [Thermomicrobium sp.]|nr:hypothetical protein [Thermomicrobium sp.]MCS7246390.1 hypothetical protein [Thermomicrobium sp.]MDW7981953.1 hypothetical protein [Thermomicrobium sp.]
MSGEPVPYEQPSLQDVDLLGRLTQFFDALEHHVRAGHGWFIFNARGPRGSRITSFILGRLGEYRLLYTYYFVPWRDFALNAYMVEVELQSLAAQRQSLEGRVREEFDIATRVSRDNLARMMVSDVLIVAGVQPRHRHELVFLDQAIERRFRQRLSTILITPAQPHELAEQFERVAPGERFWERLFERMYQRSLIAL